MTASAPGDRADSRPGRRHVEPDQYRCRGRDASRNDGARTRSGSVTPGWTGVPLSVAAAQIDHWGHAETVEAAVRGARLGLGDSSRANFGLALYVDFTATEAHWTAYRAGWCFEE